MFNRGTRSLPMHEVAIHKSILQQWSNSIYIILPHLSNILEQETQRFEYSVLYVQLGYTVFIHEGGQYGEWRTGLGYDSDGHRGTHTVLTLLDLRKRRRLTFNNIKEIKGRN
jgi:hypothetical protein